MRRVIAVAVLTFVATACGASGQPKDGAATPETAAAPSGHPRAGGRSAVRLDDLQMMSATAGWALVWSSDPAGSGDPMLEPAVTRDGGRHWLVVTPSAARALLPNGQALLYAASAERAWLAVNGGDSESTVVFATTDGGQRWTESNAVAGDYAVAFDFSGPDRGWLLVAASAGMGQEPAYVYGTASGGTTWSLLSSDLPVVCDKTGIALSSAGTGWVTSTCTAGYQVLVSRDGGVQWAAAPLPLRSAACPDGCVAGTPQFAGTTTFLEMSSYPAPAVLLVSTDDGASWRTEAMPAGAGPYPRVTFFGHLDAIAVSAGSQSVIGRDFYLTSDGGVSWTAVPQGRQFGSTGARFSFISPQLGFGWPAGGQQLYQTSDSGRTWTTVVPQLR